MQTDDKTALLLTETYSRISAISTFRDVKQWEITDALLGNS